MTANEAGYTDSDSSYDYNAAGKRCSNMTADSAGACFDSLAQQHGVRSGAYGSWDMFWMGYNY